MVKNKINAIKVSREDNPKPQHTKKKSHIKYEQKKEKSLLTHKNYPRYKKGHILREKKVYVCCF